ncbi:MAG: Gfo/Idh/MocA family oxidoreductase [Chloroflexota bacterium]
MPAKLRIGIMGLSHDHVWPNLDALMAGDLGEPVIAADPDPELRARMRASHGGIDLADDPSAVLDRRDVDVVWTYSDNRSSAAYAAQALGMGRPTVIEKPMAADLAGAEAALAASKATGTPLMVNWPTAWRAAVQHGLRLVREGAVGEPIQFSYRGSQIGPREYGCSPQFCEWLYDEHRCGGGVLIDYGGYGAVLSYGVLGRPSSVTAVAAHLRKPDLKAEDNAIITLRYPCALSLLECSWTQIGMEPGYGFIVYGDRGTVLVHQPKAAREGAPALPGRVQLVTLDQNTTADPPDLPADERDGPTYFLTRVRDGRPIEGLCDPVAGVEAQRILDAAQRSVRESRTVHLS